MRVTGFQVKQAVSTAVQKQLAAAGVTVDADGLDVTFNGRTAAVSYRYGHSGTRLSLLHIIYPTLHDAAILSRADADRISQMTLHEMGHVLYTDRNKIDVALGFLGVTEDGALTRGHPSTPDWRQLPYSWDSRAKQAFKKVLNGLEDPRIEAAMSTQTPVAAQAFRDLLNWLTERHVGIDPTTFNNAPYLLALLGRDSLGNGNAVTAGILASIPEPYRSAYARAAGGLLSAPLWSDGTDHTISLTIQFLNDWLKINPSLFDSPQPTEEPSTEDGTGSDSEEDSEEDSEDGFGDGFEDDSEDDSEDESDDDSEDDSEDESDDDSDDDDDADDDFDDESDDDFDDEPDDDFDDESEDGSADDAGGEDGWPAPEDPTADRAGAMSDDYVEPDVSKLASEIFKGIEDRNPNLISYPAHQTATRKDASTVITGRRAMWAGVIRNQKGVKKWRPATVSAGMAAQLRRLLTAPDRIGWDSKMTSGRFDGRRVSKLISGSETVFKRRWEDEGVDTAVSICVDLSGSMQGDKLWEARDVATTLALCVERAGCKVEVTGFSDATEYRLTRGDLSRGFEDLESREQFWGENSNCLIVFKPFNKRVHACTDQLDNMVNVTLGGTPDFHCVRTLHVEMARRSERQKIIFVISDGFGDDMPSMSDLTHKANRDKSANVTIVGIGIGVREDHFRKVYSIGSTVSNVSELGGAAVKAIIKQIKGRR